MPDPKETGISEITGKMVVIRHANDGDMVYIKENLKKYGFDSDDLARSQFVVAAEDDEIIGFGSLRRTGSVYDIGCIAVVEQKRRRGIATWIIKHLIEFAPVDTVYAVSDLVDYMKKLGFKETEKRPQELVHDLDVACNIRGKRATRLMAYEKK